MLLLFHFPLVRLFFSVAQEHFWTISFLVWGEDLEVHSERCSCGHQLGQVDLDSKFSPHLE